jgi:FtsZ-interacting cell division protein ZipA
MRPVLFAQVAPDINQVWSVWHIDSATREWLIILGAVALVALLALVWAAFFRKPRRHRHSHHHHHHHHHRHHHSDEPSERPIAPNEADASVPQERRRRRRRSHHRPRPLNPTLAETGGLPPIRPEDPPEAAP